MHNKCQTTPLYINFQIFLHTKRHIFRQPAHRKDNRIPGKCLSLNLPMTQFSILILLLLFMFSNVKAVSPSVQNTLPSQNAASSFQPSFALVIAVLAVIFTVTFILLFCAKFCYRDSSSVDSNQRIVDGLIRSGSRFSGIDKAVVESLPFFRFSSLRGSREGLECAVCLSRFEDVEILRLLPKCRHAFHVGCVDQWLEKHSSCPLCRHKVKAEDLELLTYSNSLRFLWNHSELREDSNLELFVQRDEEGHRSSRFSVGSSFRKDDEGKKEEELPIQENCDLDENHEKLLHKFNHKIMLSDSVLKSRWSNLSSSDLMFLNSEMINAMSSDRFSPLDSNNEESATTRVIKEGEIMKIREEMEMKRVFESKVGKINQTDLFPLSGGFNSREFKANPSYASRILSPIDKRSMSEITVHPRFTEFSMKNSTRESSLPENAVKEERLKRLWLPIARRTVQWFANREERSQQPQNTRQSLNV